MFALLLAAALAQTAPADTPAPELWHGARVGMTQPQVQAMFPEGRGAPATTFGSPPTRNAVEGAAAAYAVDEEVFGHPGIATYYFQSGGLLEVIVEMQNLRLRHTRDNVQIARDVEHGLLQYYGPAKVCIDSDQRGFARLDCRWVTPQAQVGLSYVDYGGLSPALNVAVRALPPKKKFESATFHRRGGH